MKRKIPIKSITLCALFTALTAIGAFIKIPIPILPITLQTFFVMMSGLLLGSKLGALCMAIYAALGLIGLPIFTSGGGIWYVLKPSFGYIIGFIPASFVIGLLTEKKSNASYLRFLLGCFAGLSIIYVIGMIYYYIISNCVINLPISLWNLMLYCFFTTILGDIVLSFISAYIAKRTIPLKAMQAKSFDKR